jgi:hypothetical protein
MERWVLGPSRSTCNGCRYLSRVGPFVRGTCPRPPLHEHCDCRVSVIPTGGLGAGARVAMEAEARRNSTRAGAILARAQNLRDRG